MSNEFKAKLESALSYDIAYRARLLAMEKFCDEQLGIHIVYDSWTIPPSPTQNIPVTSNPPSDMYTTPGREPATPTSLKTSPEAHAAISTVNWSDLSLESDVDLRSTITSSADPVIQKDDTRYDSAYGSMSDDGSESTNDSL
jgi:hypothetical protein